MSSFGHAIVDVAVVNPVFSFRARNLFRAAMHLCGKSVMYYTTLPGEPVSEPVVSEFCAVAGRRVVLAPSASPTSLFVLPRSASSEAGRRTCINARVVVVGDSDTAVSCCEGLVSHPHLRFANLTLLTPHGEIQPSNGPTHIAGYSRLELQRLGLGIGNRCQVMPGRMVGLDRGERVVYLEDESAVQYESLALCSSLFESTRMNLGLPEELPVFEASELPSLFVDEVNKYKAVGGFLIYGYTLDALMAGQALEQFGVHRDHIRYLRPVGSTNDNITELAFSEAGVAPEEVQPLVDVAYASVKQDTITVVFGTNQDNEMTLQAGALVCCDVKDVDADVFACVDGSGLVFDGRLVVDGQCRTADARVYAAGDIAKFSRSLAKRGTNLRHENLDGRECGHVLASAIAARYAPEGSKLDMGAVLPQFARPCIRGITRLPGVPDSGLLYASLPGLGGTLAAPAGGSIVGEGQGFKMGFTMEGKIAWLLYHGPNVMDLMPMTRLVGLSATYLSGTVSESMEDGARMLMDMLQDPWTSALKHERFSETRDRLVTRLQAAPKSASGDGTRPSGMRGMVHDCMISFVRSHARDLKLYNLQES